MDLKALKSFHQIVKAGSFIRAAEEMNYAQSTLTMQIKKLEADVGATLFERGKTISLTEAGRLFYEHSLGIVQGVDRLQGHLADWQSGEAGAVRLGATEPSASLRLPALLKGFMAEYPRITVSVEVTATAAIADSLRRGDLDLALCTVPAAGEGLFFQPLFQEEFVLLLPAEHPLASKPSVRLKDLDGQRLLITSPTCPYRRKLDMFLQEAGSISVPTMEIGSMMALKSYVEEGIGLAFVPRTGLEPMNGKTVVRSMEGAPVDMLTGLLCRASDYPPTMASAKLYRYLENRLSK